MLPKELPDDEKLELARAFGFEGIEAYPMEDLGTAKRLGDLARTAGVPIPLGCATAAGRPSFSPIQLGRY